jgi:hypothetical protein
MGHTHVPRMEQIDEHSTYINLGGWAVDDLDGYEIPPPPNSHLVIRRVHGQPVAELRRWDRQHGAVLLEGSYPGQESGVHLRPAGVDERVA